jgi:hypothetical protein
MKRLALCCLLLVLPSMHAAAADELQPFTVRYAWTLKGLSAGTSTVTLKRLTGDRWSYASRSVARGLFRLIASGDITQDSTMRVIGTQVLPERSGHGLYFCWGNIFYPPEHCSGSLAWELFWGPGSADRSAKSWVKKILVELCGMRSLPSG